MLSKRIRNALGGAATIALALVGVANAQQDARVAPVDTLDGTATEEHTLDSVVVADSARADKAYVAEEPTEDVEPGFEPTKSPWGAMARSAVIPGWGQLYNESYYKVPVVFGAFAWIGYNVVDFHDGYLDYRQRYLDDPNEPYYRTLREWYRDQRDLFILYGVVAYLANLADAYVDAHMFDFTVEEDFHRNPVPTLKIRYGF
jgi:hypothetical protein